MELEFVGRHRTFPVFLYFFFFSLLYERNRSLLFDQIVRILSKHAKTCITNSLPLRWRFQTQNGGQLRTRYRIHVQNIRVMCKLLRVIIYQTICRNARCNETLPPPISVFLSLYLYLSISLRYISLVYSRIIISSDYGICNLTQRVFSLMADERAK